MVSFFIALHINSWSGGPILIELIELIIRLMFFTALSISAFALLT